jgi:hypothetical protein
MHENTLWSESSASIHSKPAEEKSSSHRAGWAGTGRAYHDDIVDVSVVEGAVRRNHAVVTSHLGHIRAVATAAGANITIHSV